MLKLAVLCSGNGTNLQAIIDAGQEGHFAAEVAVVISDRADARALERAREAKIEALFIDPKKYGAREEYDREILSVLRERDIGCVALAGYMRLLSPFFVKEYRDKILNIHPALLPSFKGTHGVRDALAYGVKVTGATVHFVDEELDHGPIVIQRPVEVRDDDTEETLLERIHREEHRLYPEAIRLFAEGKIRREGRRVKIS